MTSIKWLLTLAVLSLAATGDVWADHGHHGGVSVGIVVGPAWGPYYPAPAYYWPRYYPAYYPPVIIENTAPTVYVEQPQAPPTAAAAPPPTNYWYYCTASKTYYPYVKECPGGWQKVLPQPPGQP